MTAVIFPSELSAGAASDWLLGTDSGIIDGGRSRLTAPKLNTSLLKEEESTPRVNRNNLQQENFEQKQLRLWFL